MNTLIGIISKPNLFSPKPWNYHQVSSDITEKLISRNADVIALVPYRQNIDLIKNDFDNVREIDEKEKKYINRIVNLCDGIVVQGGLSSDTWEIYAIQCATKANIPVIGICAGFNNIIRAFGGQTFEMSKKEQKIHNVESAKNTHNVKIEDDGLLYKLFQKTEIAVNSIHSMALLPENLPTELKCEATFVDKKNKTTIEAVSGQNILGTKWHIELGDQTCSSLIWDYFIKECDNYKKIKIKKREINEK